MDYVETVEEVGIVGFGCFVGCVWVPFSVLGENGEERVAVYGQVPEDWENPCIWAWDEEGIMLLQPGRV